MNVLEFKEKLRNKIGELLSRSEREKAIRDHHAKRKPRPCGMTIHTGIGCNLRCTYCYIEDMGFKWSIEPYPLNGLQLVYALLSNPYFVPGETGTLIAIGSVTEPFHGITKKKTFEYIECISKYLKNPIQFSTKMYLNKEEARILKNIEPKISPLITIVSIKQYSKLEPLAPSPEKRFETIKNLREAGLKPILFLRPIIPGIIEEEYYEILEKAREYGAIGIVAGSLRVTPLILERLRKAGIPVDEIIRRIRKPLKPNVQVSVDTSDIKKEILRTAEKLGLIPFPEACMANIYTHGYICWKMISKGIMKKGEGLLPHFEMSEIIREAEELGLRIDYLRREDYKLKITITGPSKLKYLFIEYVKCKYKICVQEVRTYK